MPINCPHCRFEQCRCCNRKVRASVPIDYFIVLFDSFQWFNDHGDLECPAYAEWLRKNDPDDPDVQLMVYLRTAGMQCPNEQCKRIYEL
jgi:hypothetical protein